MGWEAQWETDIDPSRGRELAPRVGRRLQQRPLDMKSWALCSSVKDATWD